MGRYGEIWGDLEEGEEEEPEEAVDEEEDEDLCDQVRLVRGGRAVVLEPRGRYGEIWGGMGRWPCGGSRT